MRILAIDHGDARAGTAICDPSETIVRPLGVDRAARPRPRSRASPREQGAELIVVGLPVSLDGAERDAGRRRAFVRRRGGSGDRGPGRDLRRAADHPDGDRYRARRRQRPGRRARRRAPARELPARPRGGEVTGGDWHDPFAEDAEALERERRRAEREARRRERQESLGEKVGETQAAPPARATRRAAAERARQRRRAAADAPQPSRRRPPSARPSSPPPPSLRQPKRPRAPAASPRRPAVARGPARRGGPRPRGPGRRSARSSSSACSR